MSDALPLDADGPAAVVEPPTIATLGGDGKMNRGAYAWSIHQGGRDPFIILVTIYIFMPYVASVLVGDPVRGQATISSWDSRPRYSRRSALSSAMTIRACWVGRAPGSSALNGEASDAAPSTSASGSQRIASSTKAGASEGTYTGAGSAVAWSAGAAISGTRTMNLVP